MAEYPRIFPKVTQPATIGDLKVDVILERETVFDSDVTEYPVEDGFPISDHVERKPLALSLTVVCTPTPVSWFKELGASAARMNEVVDTIAAIYRKAEPITITTVDAIYEDMIMTHAPLPRNVDDGYCYRMQLDFIHIRKAAQRSEKITESGTNAEASGSAGETEKDAGAASQSEIGTGLKTVKTENGTYETDLFTVDTDAAGRATAGEIETRKEQTANAAAIAVAKSLVGMFWRG